MFQELLNRDKLLFQELLNRDKLLAALHLEFVNRVNEVGVDVNQCVAHAHTAPLIQFVCGLGPRKGYHLLRVRSSTSAKSARFFFLLLFRIFLLI